MLYLKPSNIFFSQNQISATFGKWNRHRNKRIGETLDDLCDGLCKISNIEPIKVVKKDGKWVTIDNRRLWVFHHLEAAGKCEKIPVEEVQYCSTTHGRKFDSTNGGISVRIIKGRDPGGTRYRRIKPVTPTCVTEDKNTQSKTENDKNSSNNLESKSEYLNQCIKKYPTYQSLSTVLKVKEQPASLLKTTTKDEKDSLVVSDLPRLNDNGKAKTEGKASVKSKEKTLFHSNTLKYGELYAKYKALRRVKPYPLRTNGCFNHVRSKLKKFSYTKIYQYKISELIPWYSNEIESDNSDINNNESDDIQDIESENDYSDDEFSIFVDERENSYYGDVHVSTSDDDSKEIDYDDDPWTDADEDYNMSADDEAEEGEENDDNDDDDDDDDVGDDDADDDDDDDDDENKKENENKEDKMSHLERPKDDGLIISVGQVNTVSNLGTNDDELVKRLRHIWSGQPLAEIYSLDFNQATTSKSNETNCNKSSDSTNGNIPDNDNDDKDDDDDDDDDYVVGGDDVDLSGELRSDLDYDELDVWPNELDEYSKHKTSHDSDSSDSEDDFLVAKEVEISDTEDEETYELNDHYNFDDKYERRERASKISMKRYGYDIFQSDPL